MNAPLQSGLLPWLSRNRSWLVALAAMVLVALAWVALRDLLHDMRYDLIVKAIKRADASVLGLSVIATVFSFCALVGYDHSSMRYAGAKVPMRILAPTSFIAYALGNTVGLGVLTGGAVRMRFYSAAGVEAGLISKAIAFNAISFGIGVSTVGAAGLLWGASAVAPVTHLPGALLRAFAVAILCSVALLIVVCKTRGSLRLGGAREVRLPPAGLAATQLLWSVVDIALSAFALWILLPRGVIGFPAFIGFYSMAIVVGLISHVPGGLGVFEAIMLIALGGRMPSEQLAGALVLYRAIYYLLPVALSLLLLTLYELKRGIARPLARAAEGLAPQLLAGFTFFVGAFLLVSGVTPATQHATRVLSRHVPLYLVETSHFLGSVAGLGLLLVARGLLLRLDAAWWVAMALAGISLAMTLPKGLAVSEAVILSFLIAVLFLSRHRFDRKAALISHALDGSWLLAIIVVLLAVTGLLFFAYQDVSYSEQLWWQFEFDAHAPRSLRALVAVAVIALLVAMRYLLRQPRARLPNPDRATLDRAQAIIAQQDSADAHLALMGDKHLLFSDSGRAFVMVGIRGRSWVALFDPIGPEEEHAELVWELLERAREAGGRASFYQVRPQSLPIYLDAGLRLNKLGEEAFVELADFSLKGSQRANLRQGVSRAEREGLSFEVIGREQLASIITRLREISDAWLAEQRAAEKGFSLGAFHEDYVLRNPVAVVRKADTIVAFATLMSTETKQTVSVDLMRHTLDAPKGTMDLMFSKLMLHYREQGYARFGLGMAPLSGMAEHPLAPGWHRIGRLLFARGERFYNFQGLRAFKDKFDPVWEPRYLASPGGVAPLFVLTDIAALISGGLRGVFVK